MIKNLEVRMQKAEGSADATLWRGKPVSGCCSAPTDAAGRDGYKKWRDGAHGVPALPCLGKTLRETQKIEVHREISSFHRVLNRTRFPKESCIIVFYRGKNKESFFREILNKRKWRTRRCFRMRMEFQVIPTDLRYFETSAKLD